MQSITQSISSRFHKLCLVLALSAGICADASAQSAIYACGHIRRERATAIDILRNSGYSTAILFNVNVETDGSLTTDFAWSTQTAAEAGGIICRDGRYVFADYQPEYTSDIRRLLEQPTSISRIEICIGGWTNQSYSNIKTLVQQEGTGPESILYRNFKALKEAIPEIAAVNNDLEHEFDVASAVEFHRMLATLGYKTTIAPFSMKDKWRQFVEELNREPGTVEIVYLQTYGGGAANSPADWMVFGDVPMYVGFDCEASANMTDMENKFRRWSQTPGVVGGFLWNYNSEARNQNQWACAINRIFHAATPSPAAVVYSETDFGGYAVSLPAGRFTRADLASYGVAASDISSLSLTDGYAISLFMEDDLSGASVSFTESQASLGRTWNNRACSLVIEPADSGVVEIYDISTLPAGTRARIYDAAGRLMADSSDAVSVFTLLPPGTYIVATDTRSYKILKGN